MQIPKNKTMAILITLILTFSMSASIILQPTVSAHTPPWTVLDYAYVTVAPNPIGVGQQASVCMWVDYPFYGATLQNNLRRTSYQLTITKPDGTNLTENFPTITDPTGVQYWQYTPDQVGNYTFSFYYPGQTYTWSLSGVSTTNNYTNDIYTPASSTVSLTVQQTPIPAPIDSYPLPTQFWTRPIEGQNTYWYAIASNWLAAPYIIGAPPGTHGPGGIQPYGSAPNGAHVMWTKPIQYGGVVGGNDTTIPGEMYYAGLSYNTRFQNPIIMQGTLFYQEPFGNGGTGGDYVAVDLTTGHELWRINASATGVSLVPSFGYLYSLDTPNQHGILPEGALIASTNAYTGLGTVWRAYDPRTGVLTTMNITNIPSGSAAAGPAGEYLLYTLSNLGTANSPKWYLSQWNSSNVFGGVAGTGVGTWYSGTANASLPSAYDWNVSIPTLAGTGWSIGAGGGASGLIPIIDVGNMILLIQGTFGWHPDMSATITASLTLGPANVTAISINPQTFGQVLWSQSYPQAPQNVTRTIVGWDPSNRVLVFEDKETFAHWGYSLKDGSLLWGPTVVTNDYTTNWNFFSLDSDTVANGMLYYFGYSGILYAYDDTNGKLLWTYGNGGTGNSTNAGQGTPYGVYPIDMSAVADGKLYLDTTEHSPNSPLYKGAQLRCVNATSGKELWTIFNYGDNMYGGNTPIADGYLVSLNSYDSQLYCFGKGPSQLTVTAPQASVELGRSLVISGTVTDVSAGTKQNAQAANFPNGVPAVSDASESSYMEYVYQQKPMPTGVTGVPVSLYVIDSNGNYRQIGSTTSDSSDTFSFQWTPDITGKYTIIASFAGSNSYYPSSAEAAFAVDPAPPTPTPQAQLVLPPTEMYIIGAAIAIIIAIAIVGAVILIALRKRP